MIEEVESFKLDHTKVQAPYLRLASKKQGKNGDIVSKFDIRITQPNVSFMFNSDIHTFEHLFAVTSREFFDDVIDFSPMGCRTGFYFTLFGDYEEKDIYDNLCKIMEKIIYWNSPIPAITKKECGNCQDHSLYGAQQIAYKWLSGVQRKGWHY